jgi:chromosome segregation ATPase
MTVDTVDEVGARRERVFQIESDLAKQQERLAGFEQTAGELEARLSHLQAEKQGLVNRHARGEDVSDDLAETRRTIVDVQSQLSDVTETIATIKVIVEETVKERASAMSSEQSARSYATGDEALQKLEVARITAVRLVAEIKEAATLFDTASRLLGGNAIRSDLHIFARDVETWAQLVR